MALRLKVLQAQQDDLGRVLEQSGPVLLLALLHPVAVDPEGAAVDELPHAAERVWVSGQNLPGQRSGPAIPAVHPDAGQNAHDQNLDETRRERALQIIIKSLVTKLLLL